MGIKNWLGSMVMTAAVCGSAATLGTTIDKIIVFGDSLSDNGNVYNMLATAKNVIPLVPLIPKNPPYHDGRFTNGIVWVEQLAKSMHVPLVNYAYGGAWAEGIYESGQILPPSLSLQVDMYSIAPSTVIDFNMKKHLYVIWAGSNDYLRGRSNTDSATTNTVDAIAIQIDWLFRMGARNFLILNLADLSKTPTSIEKGPDFALALQKLVIKHNEKLAQRVEKLRGQYSSATIVYLNITDEFDDLIMHPEKYKLKNVAEACYDGGYMFGARQFVMNPEIEAAKEAKFEISNNSVLMDAYLNSLAAKRGHQSCNNPDEYLFWDKTHPTRVTHQLIGLAALLKLSETGISGS